MECTHVTDRMLVLLVFALLITADVWIPAARAEPAYVLRIATLAPAASPTGREYQNFRRELAERTNGQVSVRMYAGGVAGDERTVVRKIRAGQLDGALLTTAGLGAVVRQVLVLESPGLITSYSELDRVRERLRPELSQLFDEAGYELIAWGDAGRVRLFSKHRLERPADLRGVRPWVWRDSYTMKAFIEAAGANGVVLGVPEVYPGLQTNMIDTVISSSIGVLGFQWHAALKTMSKPASGVVVGAFIIKKDRLEALPEAAQRYIRDTANDTEAKFMRIGRKLDDDASRALAKRLEVVDMAPFRGAWEATARRARDSLVGRLYSKQLLERVQAIVEAP
ncbi:MAG: TRAP transporter substrate-binding protein DctP [Myxococcales bacterium]|nr:TRAP transporter substrate-binding protein DctP [Myxococcales bacterium]